MRILAFNCGSSSIKCRVIDDAAHARGFELRAEGIGGASPRIVVGETTRPLPGDTDVRAAIDAALAELRARWPELGEIEGVVHRVVHGGERFTDPVVIAGEVLDTLDELGRLAPLHNPPAIHAIHGARALFPHCAHVAVFDTAFHATLPDDAREYALPVDIRARYGIRRYGFHG